VSKAGRCHANALRVEERRSICFAHIWLEALSLVPCCEHSGTQLSAQHCTVIMHASLTHKNDCCIYFLLQTEQLVRSGAAIGGAAMVLQQQQGLTICCYMLDRCFNHTL
jgi:hypothetical protein